MSLSVSLSRSRFVRPTGVHLGPFCPSGGSWPIRRRHLLESLVSLQYGSLWGLTRLSEFVQDLFKHHCCFTKLMQVNFLHTLLCFRVSVTLAIFSNQVVNQQPTMTNRNMLWGCLESCSTLFYEGLPPLTAKALLEIKHLQCSFSIWLHDISYEESGQFQTVFQTDHSRPGAIEPYKRSYTVILNFVSQLN